MPVCADCGGSVIEYDTAAGNGFCLQCGTVVEENTIVSEVTFGESSNGAAVVQGSYVASGATRARIGGKYGNQGGGSESREQTIANASRKIQGIAHHLRLSEIVCHAATRLYTLAVEHKFTKGRKSMNVVAICIYVACRQKETHKYMLIDFSDLLQVNVFELGHTYLQLVQTLNLRLPLVDPSHYISRFSALLEFGDDTHQVALDAVRLVQRFDRDWMTRGRRPAGICGAALLLAARMNNFRRSVEEVVQVVKIADVTLRKRLEEFKRTPSGALTLSDFRTVWLEEEMDPPAYTKGREKDANEEEDEATQPQKKKKMQKSKRKRKRNDVDDDSGSDEATAPTDPPPYIIDSNLFNQGILSGTTEAPPLFLPEEPDDATSLSLTNPSNNGNATIDPTADATIDPALLSTVPVTNTFTADPTTIPGLNSDKEVDPMDEEVDKALAEELNAFLGDAQGATLHSALEEAEARRLAAREDVEDLTGLDEEELDAFILTDEEVRIKERVWVELNRDYLEALAARGLGDEGGGSTAKSKKRRKTKSRDSAPMQGQTAAESARGMLRKNPRFSKKINYDAISSLLGEGNDANAWDPDAKDDGGLYTFDENEKDDGELVIVEEEGGVVGMASPPAAKRKRKVVDSHETEVPDADAHGGDADGDLEDYNDDDKEDKDDEVWFEGYEQEA